MGPPHTIPEAILSSTRPYSTTTHHRRTNVPSSSTSLQHRGCRPNLSCSSMYFQMMCASRPAHHRARASAMTPCACRYICHSHHKSQLHQTTANPRPVNGGPTMGSPDCPPTNGNGIVVSSQPIAINSPENTWTSPDMGGVNIKNLPPTSGHI